MGLPLADVKRIKEEFEKEYWDKGRGPYSQYINMCGVSTVGINDLGAPVEQQKDFCILVGLCKALPPGLTLPQEYQGVRVFMTAIGEIRLLA